MAAVYYANPNIRKECKSVSAPWDSTVFNWLPSKCLNMMYFLNKVLNLYLNTLFSFLEQHFQIKMCNMEMSLSYNVALSLGSWPICPKLHIYDAISNLYNSTTITEEIDSNVYKGLTRQKWLIVSIARKLMTRTWKRL